MLYPATAPRVRRRGAPRAPAIAASLLATTLAACGDLPPEPALPTEPAPPPPAAGAAVAFANPLAGMRLYVDPASNARRQADAWRASRPADAAEMDKIAASPQAVWLGEWIGDPYRHVDEVMRRVGSAGATPVLVVYNIPLRDCGQYSSGGANNPAAYRQWVGEVARGIGGRPAVVILEPDALAGMDCLGSAERAQRVELLRAAVGTLAASGRAAVYIDAGHPRWHAPGEMADRLLRAGVAGATGFALNVSNFVGTEENVRYGDAVSERVGGRHYVVDTSRNGLGPAADNAWCNPAGRALGARPTTAASHPRVDALLWIKRPGESDGACNGGPAAGSWWAEYALGLARRSQV